MEITPIKMGLLIIIVLEITSIFYFLHVYHEFVSTPENYYQDILVGKNKPPQQMIDQ